MKRWAGRLVLAVLVWVGVLGVCFGEGGEAYNDIKTILLEGLMDPIVNKEGQELLERMAEVNRYWLVGPPKKVGNYSYDFKLYDLKSGEAKEEAIKVKHPAKADSKQRQGITYDSVLHRLISDPSAVIIRKMQKNQQIIRLDFVFRDFTEVTCGNGISHSWRGYFTGLVKVGSLWLDAERTVPVKVTAGWQREYFCDYIEVDDEHYVPLRITVGHDDSAFHWTFGFYDAGLWLFRNAYYGEDEEGQRRMAASINNVRINGESAVEANNIAVEVGKLKERPEVKDGKSSEERKTVTVILNGQDMSFEGKTVRWDEIGTELADLPEPDKTGLKLAVAADILSSEKLNDAKIRISILSRELGLGYLSCISGDESAAEKSAKEYFFRAPLEFDKEIYIRQSADAEFKQKYYRTDEGWAVDETEQHKVLASVLPVSVRFEKTFFKGKVSAKLKVARASWPRSKWRFTIVLLDEKGRSMGEDSDELATGGEILSGRVLRGSSELDFSFGADEKLSKARSFELTLVPIGE